MMNEAKITELTQAEDMAYFRADLCCYSPDAYIAMAGIEARDTRKTRDLEEGALR